MDHQHGLLTLQTAALPPMPLIPQHVACESPYIVKHTRLTL